MYPCKRPLALLLAVVLVSALGCAVTATPEITGERVTDAWITTQVRSALIEDPQIRATEVNVETFKGTVQLSGFVSSNAAIYMAELAVRGIKGVTGIKNDMRVK